MQHTPEHNQPSSPISDTGSNCSTISSASTASSQDVVMNRIAQLTKLVDRGIVKKADLAPMISAIYLGRQNNYSTPTKTSPSDTVGEMLQRGNVSYRTPASPETCRIRRWIEVPIRRRFELQAATVDSPL